MYIDRVFFCSRSSFDIFYFFVTGKKGIYTYDVQNGLESKSKFEKQEILLISFLFPVVATLTLNLIP